MKWLHVTDLHFGVTEHESTTMLKNLHKVAELTGPVDCLFITGDLRYAAKCPKSYPSEAETALINLREALGVKPEHVFIVPGNHDVNSDQFLPGIVNLELKTYHQSGQGTISLEALSALEVRQKDFDALCAKIGRKKESFGIHYCVQLPDFPFNIICLNTALFCYYYKAEEIEQAQKDDNLILGKKHIDLMFENEVNPHKPVIILAHHPLDGIDTWESKYFKTKLEECLDDRKDIILYLCGHTHEFAMEPVSTRLNRHRFLTCIGGTGMNFNPNHQKPDMDVFYGEINDAATEVKFRAFKWEYRKLKGWMPDSTFSYEKEYKALDGWWYFPPDLRPKPEDMVKREYLAWLKERCGGMESVAERRRNPSPQNLNRLFVQPRLLASTFDKIRQRRERETTSDVAEKFCWKPEGRSAVRMVVVSDPGGGKSTLLKWFAWVYAGQEEKRSERTGLPLKEDVFPVWLPCRNANTLLSMEDIIRQAFSPNLGKERLFSIFQDYRTRGDALLLIDGLDEADNQKQFLDQLCKYLKQPENQSLHVILTVRRAGLKILTKTSEDNKTSFQERLNDRCFGYSVIAPLNPDEIEALSQKWWDAYGNAPDRKYTEWQIRQISKSRVRELAQNPLLLTAMLFVQLRYNRLPAQLSTLYNSALEALLEGERKTPFPSALGSDEIIRFLAYVALKMTPQNKVIISETELRPILRELWEKRPDLIQRANPENAFLQSFFRYLDEESVILRPVDSLSGKEYEFQYRSFQEYLSALAAVEFYYPDYTETERPGHALETYLKKEYWKNMQEVILLASLISMPCGRRLARLAMKEIKSTNQDAKKEYLRDTLLLMLEKETPLPNELALNILRTVLTEQPQYSDMESIAQIFKGRYKNLMEKRLHEIGNEQHGEPEYWTPLIHLLQGAETAPYRFYWECRDMVPPRLEEGISMLSCALWLMSENNTLLFGDINLEHQADELKAELLQKAGDNSTVIQWHAFRALNHLIKITHEKKFSSLSGEERAQYALTYMSYLNRAEEIEKTSRLIPAVDLHGLIDGVKELLKSPDGATRIRDSLFQDKPLERLCAFFESQTEGTPSCVNQWDLFSVAFLAATFRGSGPLVRRMFSVIERWRDIYWESEPDYYDMLSIHFLIASSLWERMKDSPIYSMDEWKTVEYYIFSMDRATILHAEKHGHMKTLKLYFDVSNKNRYYPDIYGTVVKGDERDPERVCEFIKERIGES